MTSSHTLAEFQQAAVDHIVSRLRDKRGSQRFLLADEVGLGKTIVARGVIDELAKRRRQTLKVVYLCSNTEIAEQNRKKLVSDGGTSVKRATELVLLRPDRQIAVDMYAFTPGTSLAGGTGMMSERLLMLFLLNRACGKDVSARKWRQYFRCGAGEARWDVVARWASLRDAFSNRTSSQFQSALRSQLNGCMVDGQSLLRSIVEGAETFSTLSAEDRRRRNKLIGAYRGVLQRVALQLLKPDLLVLDEVQRFKDVIDKADDQSSIAFELFKAKTPVLILSATPYRLLTSEREAKVSGSSHHDDFYSTLQFLFANDKKSPARVQKNFNAFGERLQSVKLDRERDPQLLKLKRDVENDLRKVISRTERNWFFLDNRRGIAEQGLKERKLPGRDELREFMDIHQGLSEHLDGVGLVTEFWKSAPSVLTFMDASYALTKKLRTRKVRVPRTLLERADNSELPRRNLRVQRVMDHAIGTEDSRPFLWTQPTYTYHEDRTYGSSAPRKMLVFSGWRFVPKAVAVLVSDAAATRIGKRGADRKQPLRFTKKGSLHVFDTCLPSWALVDVVDPLAVLATTDGSLPRPEIVLQHALSGLRKRLKDVGIAESTTRADSMWEVLARLEQSSAGGKEFSDALSSWAESAESDEAEAAADRICEWLSDTSRPLSIGRADLYRLALIAVASPAVCLLRSLRHTYGDEEAMKSLPEFISLCLNEMRSYFNRSLVQRTIRKHAPTFRWARKRMGSKRSYSEGLLSYALDHHLQAVLDEHTYLLRHASASASAADAVGHFRSVWSLGRGSRRTNRASGRGTHVGINTDGDSWPTHFALAFGEDTAAEATPLEEEDRRMRRSDVREAFNSPFWPFVLATTSVGQEGLDFHLHCRDVFHWNLPSNPVDLEQREGRINRRDCLAVRQSIAKDVSLHDAVRLTNGQVRNPWAAIFQHLESEISGGKRKHGLHPHWIYECKNRSNTVAIERHVAFFDASRDSQKYERLKTGLALYRLVFGQVNQEHLLTDLEKRLAEVPAKDREAVKQHLSGYMLNLSPIDSAVALRLASEEAKRILSASDGTGIRQLLDDVEAVVSNHEQELDAARPMLEKLKSELLKAVEKKTLNTHRVRQVTTALAYLRNPYDQYFDGQSVGGFDDDIDVMKRALRRA